MTFIGRVYQTTRDEIVVERDGHTLCARFSDFQNLQEAPSGFGVTDADAIASLASDVRKDYSDALLDLLGASRRCLMDLEHYASTHGPGPDHRLLALKKTIQRVDLSFLIPAGPAISGSTGPGR